MNVMSAIAAVVMVAVGGYAIVAIFWDDLT